MVTRTGRHDRRSIIDRWSRFGKHIQTGKSDRTGGEGSVDQTGTRQGDLTFSYLCT